MRQDEREASPNRAGRLPPEDNLAACGAGTAGGELTVLRSKSMSAESADYRNRYCKVDPEWRELTDERVQRGLQKVRNPYVKKGFLRANASRFSLEQFHNFT